MKNEQRPVEAALGLRSKRRKAVALEQPFDIHAAFDNSFVLAIEAKADGLALDEWARSHKDLIAAKLLEAGAILFRGFQATMDSFQGFVRGTYGEPLDYHERSSPRTVVGPGVYSSTDYPAPYRIFFHNENSYQQQWPGKLIFFCVVAPPEGGATPLSDVRKVTKELDKSIIRAFQEKGVLYQRNYGPEIGMPWQMVFQTSSRQDVEEYCRNSGIDHEWLDSEHLRTRQKRSAFIRHPKTGEELWFNHAAFFHISTLEPSVRDTLLAEFEEDELPNNTYYGDGTGLEDSVVEEIRNTYVAASGKFDWRPRDVLVVDNMLTAHSREPFRGERKIVVSMADLVHRSEGEKEWR